MVVGVVFLTLARVQVGLYLKFSGGVIHLAVLGSWVREMAEKYEHADFVGVDIVPVPSPAVAMTGHAASSLLTTPQVSNNNVL